MTDADKISLLGVVAEGIARQRKKAQIGGARVHVIDSECMLDTLMGILHGERVGGMQDDEDVGQEDADAIRAGVPFAVCGIGYGRVRDY